MNIFPARIHVPFDNFVKIVALAQNIWPRQCAISGNSRPDGQTDGAVMPRELPVPAEEGDSGSSLGGNDDLPEGGMDAALCYPISRHRIERIVAHTHPVPKPTGLRLYK